MDFIDLIRPNIRQLQPYRSARSEFQGLASVWLDANENPFNNGFNRYPDPKAFGLRAKLARLKGLEPEQVFVGNGSDEVIDLLFRLFCVPGRDEVLVCPPTYGMYAVAAGIQDVLVKEVELDTEGQPQVEKILAALTENTKLLFLCSPNNPTGQLIDPAKIERLLREFPGILVIDEAYIDFAEAPSWIEELESYPRLVVMQTFSKAWGRAGIRLGMAYAHATLIEWLDRIKPPYNVNVLTQGEGFRALSQLPKMKQEVARIIRERSRMAQILPQLPGVLEVYPSEANFLLVRCEVLRPLRDFLADQGIVVRVRAGLPVFGDCLRITIGTDSENTKLIEAWRAFFSKRTAPKK
jgi:histidinol-phosphate aminotransferase